MLAVAEETTTATSHRREGSGSYRALTPSSQTSRSALSILRRASLRLSECSERLEKSVDKLLSSMRETP